VVGFQADALQFRVSRDKSLHVKANHSAMRVCRQVIDSTYPGILWCPQFRKGSKQVWRSHRIINYMVGTEEGTTVPGVIAMAAFLKVSCQVVRLLTECSQRRASQHQQEDDMYRGNKKSTTRKTRRRHVPWAREQTTEIPMNTLSIAAGNSMTRLACNVAMNFEF
jgi:hypothetical protein